MLDWKKNGVCFHVSVTYGGYAAGFPTDKNTVHKHKNAIGMALSRAGFCGIWRLEYQSRESAAERHARILKGIKRTKGQGGSLKVPHWHFLLWVGDQDLVDAENWLLAWWPKFSGNDSPFAIRITSGDQARGAWYLGMHAAKSAQSPPFAVGRWWGYINRERVLGASDLHCHGEIDERVRVWWARLYKRSTGGKVRNNSGLSWFLPRKYQTEVNAWILQHIEHERYERHKGKPPF